MSASNSDSSIFLSDTNNQIKKKIGQAFSGGQDTRELHREIGGRTEIDVPFQYLTFFLEDDEELERIRVAYEKGEMESGEMKMACTKEIQVYVSEFRERRAQVTEALRDEYTRPRQLIYKGMPNQTDQMAALEKEKTLLEERRRFLDAEIARLKGENEDIDG